MQVAGRSRCDRFDTRPIVGRRVERKVVAAQRRFTDEQPEASVLARFNADDEFLQRGSDLAGDEDARERMLNP